jgi:hypothetical protein
MSMKNPLMTWASRLQFPKLLLLTAALFTVDLLFPDFIPFIDEILLGLTTIVLASIKKRRTDVLETSAAQAEPAVTGGHEAT